MTLVEVFDNITTSEIDRYIKEMQEENLTLEFQTVNYPAIGEGNFDLEMLARAMSGFANSQGGIVVWGVFVKKDDNGNGSATRKHPIKDLNGFMEFLNEATETVVSPAISGVKHRMIEEASNVGFAATYVPSSLNAPHMDNFKKVYFKRNGAIFYKCEHFDVTDMLSRNQIPNLELIVYGATPTESTGNSYTIIFGLSNTGITIAKFPMLRIKINLPYKYSQFGLGGAMNTGMEKGLDQGDGFEVYIAKPEQVIYPGVLLQVDQLEIELPAGTTELPPLKIEYSAAAEGMSLVSETMTYRLKI